MRKNIVIVVALLILFSSCFYRKQPIFAYFGLNLEEAGSFDYIFLDRICSEEELLLYNDMIDRRCYNESSLAAYKEFFNGFYHNSKNEYNFYSLIISNNYTLDIGPYFTKKAIKIKLKSEDSGLSEDFSTFTFRVKKSGDNYKLKLYLDNKLYLEKAAEGE